MSSSKVIMVKCPTCTKEFSYYSSESRPFCTDRCKMIDAGHWLNETYAIPGKDNTVYIEDSENLEKLLEDTDENY